MRLFHPLVGFLTVGTIVGLTLVARSQSPVDTGRVLQWLDSASGLVRYTSSQYPLPMRPPPVSHTTLPGVALASGVTQVVIPAGAVVTGCDITFSNSLGDYFLAWTDPSAPTVPTAAAPAGFGSVTIGTGRGLHLQINSGSNVVQGLVYHCPGPSAQGVSVVYIANAAGQASPPSPSGLISVDVY